MKPSLITFDSFNKIIILISYLDESASSMLKILFDIPDLGDCMVFRKKHCEDTLLGIRNRSQKLKTELIDAVKEHSTFPGKIGNMNYYYENIQKDFKELNEIVEPIYEAEYFVDPQGKLNRKTKENKR
jgi:hypothetical protein